MAHLSGEIDRSNAAELGERMADAIGASQSGGLVVDLTKLAFIDSTGMRMLFGLAARAEAAPPVAAGGGAGGSRTWARSSTRSG